MTSTTTTNRAKTNRPKELPCGCILGIHLCPEAVLLWDKVNSTYEKVQIGIAFWDEYDQVRWDYASHFGRY
jgi:hypothetical protein